RSQSRGTCSGGVCQNTRLTLPSFICTVPPWGRSTVRSVRCRRRSAPRTTPTLAPLFAPTSAPRPGSPSASGPPPRPPPPPAPPRCQRCHAEGAPRRGEAPDPREVAARRAEAARVFQRDLEPLHIHVEPADLLQVLVLPERRLDGPPDRREVLSRRQEERDRAIAQLELARDRLGGAVGRAGHVAASGAHGAAPARLCLSGEPAPPRA